MNAKKRITATLAGFIVYFLLGWLVYGFLLRDFYAANSTASVMRPDAEMVWWALIVGNILQSYLLVYIFGNWANVETFGDGFKNGFVLGLIMSFAMGLTMYGTMDFNSLTATLVDPFVFAAMMGITGGVIGIVLGKK